MATIALRQGDVLFVRVDTVPEDALLQPRGPRIVVMEGEATGHAHAIAQTETVQHYRDPGLDMQWIVVEEQAVEVRHEEHQTVVLPPGIWMIPVQVQVQRKQVRRVLD